MRGVLLYGLAQVPGGLPIPVHSPVPLCAKTAEFAYPGPQTRQGIVTIRADGLFGTFCLGRVLDHLDGLHWIGVPVLVDDLAQNPVVVM